MDADIITALSGAINSDFPNIRESLADEAAGYVISGDEPPTWLKEGHKSEEAYRQYWAEVVNDWLKQSKDKYMSRKKVWMFTDKRVELTDKLSRTVRPNASNSDLILVPQALEKAISLQLEGRPRFYFEPIQVADEEFVSGLNYYTNLVLNYEKFDIKLAKLLQTCKKFGTGVFKITIDYDTDEQVIPGQSGKICIREIDPRYCWPDVAAKSWDDWTFFICAEPMDIEEARRLYPQYADKIMPDSCSLGDVDEEKQSFLSQLAGHNNERRVGRRDRVTVKECWLRDATMKFEPKLDAHGNPVYDANGEVMGEFKLAYPKGRLIIVVGDELVFDGPNPYRHGRHPYVVLNDRVSSELFPIADCDILLPLEDKLNIQHKDIFRNVRANINAPWIVSNSAFDSTDKYDQLTSEEAAVITYNEGATAPNRLPPQDIPQGTFAVLNWFQSVFNDLSGVSNIQQGMLQKGAQLSADAIAQLQGASASNIKMKQLLLELFLQDCGYLVQWNIRELCNSAQEIKLNDPASGKQISIMWNGSENQPDYAVNCQVTSSLPANKAGIMSTAMNLWDHDLIDREAALDQMKYPGRGKVVKRMQDRETQLAALGIQAKQRQNKTGRSGRKSN